MAPERPSTDALPPVSIDSGDRSRSENGDQPDQYAAARAAAWGPSSRIAEQPWMPALVRNTPDSGSLDMRTGAVVTGDNTSAGGDIVRDNPDGQPDDPAAVAKRAQDFADKLKQMGVDQTRVVDVDENGKPLPLRDAKDVKEIVVREGHKEGDPKPNFIIDKDGKIHEVVDPNREQGGADGGGGSVIIEIEPDREGKAAVQVQRDAAQAMIAAIRANWTNSHVGPDIPDDLIAAANAADPPPVMRQRPVGGGGGGSVIGGSGGGMARGFSGGGMAGAGGPERHMQSPPRVGSDGHLQARIPQDSPLFKALDSSKLTDRIILATAGLESGGKLDVINHNDAGHGWSVGIRQWNQQAGELPTLIQAMYDRNPEKFNQDFGQFAGKLIKNGKVDENFVRHTNFDSLGKGFENGMKQALTDFQDVQIALARQWAQSGVELAQKYGMKSELGMAEVADAVNQYGYGGAEKRLRNLGTGGDEASRIHAFDRALGSQRGSRLAQLSSKFSAHQEAQA